ncbi:MAG TPA: NAD(P)/FAD-dependent oxidoreductase [archaeon]|nr:NAD(P)/FAD-dependent oxidoreductase [archaeon]
MLKSESTDIVVIGAGPTGLIAAMEAAEHNVKVTVFEEHEEIGVPSHCAGLLSVDGLKRIGVTPSQIFVQNEIRGACFHSPTGLEFAVKGKSVMAYVVNRVAFDKDLAIKAERSGVDIRLGNKVLGLIQRDKKISGVKTRSGAVESKVVINCSGSFSTLNIETGLELPKKIIPAVQYELEYSTSKPDFVDIFVGHNVAPGFFAYVIPTSSESVRVGLACEDANPRGLLNNFVKQKMGKYKILSLKGGLISIGGPISKTYSNGFLVVGDAAGHTKPTTGGGVITGGICAKIAGRIAAESINQGNYSANFLAAYQKSWQNKLKKEFSAMSVARKMFNRLSDETIDKIFKIVTENKLQNVIEETGNIDFQSGALYSLMRQPSVIKLILTVAGDLLQPKKS